MHLRHPKDCMSRIWHIYKCSEGRRHFQRVNAGCLSHTRVTQGILSGERHCSNQQQVPLRKAVLFMKYIFSAENKVLCPKVRQGQAGSGTMVN